MELAEFLKVLEGQENGTELVEFFNQSIQNEKTIFIEKNRQHNKENQTLRQGLKDLKSRLTKIGWDGQADLDEFFETLNETIAGKKEEGSAASKELKTLQKQIEKFQNELKVEQEKRLELQKKIIESTLLPKISEEFYGSEFIIKFLISDGLVDLDETGKVIFKNGEDILDFDSGLKAFGEAHPNSKKNKQKTGSGSQPYTTSQFLKVEMATDE